MYQLQQVGEWAALLQQRQPGLPVAAWDTETAAEVAARAAAERAAVSAAAEAAAAAQLALPAVAQELEGSKGNATSVKHGADRDVGSWRVQLRHQDQFLVVHFKSRLEACCAADMGHLALYGPWASRLNLPAATYTPQQVAAWRQLLQAWRVSRAASDEPPAPAGCAVESAADAAIAAAAEVALNAAPAEAALYDGQQPPPYGSWVNRSSHRGWLALLKQTGDSKLPFKKRVQTGVQAACAVDLARLAMWGSTTEAAAALNLPASIYTQQQVAAMAAWLQLRAPGLQLAAFEPGSSSSSSSSSSSTTTAGPPAKLLKMVARGKQQARLQRAADAAVTEAAAATQAAAHISSSADGTPFDWNVVFSRGVHRVTLAAGGDTYARSSSSRLHAACAADLAQLALDRAAKTLPAESYTAQQVAVMRQLLQFERPTSFRQQRAAAPFWRRLLNCSLLRLQQELRQQLLQPQQPRQHQSK
uniref:Uncharacterized protein n=1 Tax=Tetradesmus obliquus TaxID=3088 RepID=A0A383VR01_TETOB|eukprot:jgi/Sobl393_1/9114/SZX67279.1